MQRFYQLWNPGWGAKLPTSVLPWEGWPSGDQAVTDDSHGLGGRSTRFLTPLFSDHLSSSEMSYVQLALKNANQSWPQLFRSWLTNQARPAANQLSKALSPEFLFTVELSRASGEVGQLPLMPSVKRPISCHPTSFMLANISKDFKLNEELNSLSLLNEFFFRDWLKNQYFLIAFPGTR